MVALRKILVLLKWPKSEWELRTTRLLEWEIPPPWRSLSEQRSLPRSENGHQGHGAASSHVGDAIREDMALKESILEPKKETGARCYLSLLGESMDFL